MTFHSLLPNHASPLRRTVEEASRYGLDIEFALREIDVPEKALESFIPFLAWGFSTDLWDRSWPIEKKRAVIKAWYRLHSQKGTLSGIEEALRFFGAEVVSVRRPPDMTFPDPSLTKEEREAYLAAYQQIRFYSHRSRGVAGYGAYLVSGYRLARLFTGARAFPFVSDAVLRQGRRAFLYDPKTGEEVPVRRADAVTTTEQRTALQFDEVLLPSKAGNACFCSMPPKTRYFPVTLNAGSRRYSISIQTTYNERSSEIHISAIQPAATPVDVRPRRQTVAGKRVIGQLFPSLGGVATEFVNRHSDGRARTFLPASSSHLRMFEQVFLFDPERRIDKRSGRTFIGSTRLGMPPFNAALKIETRSVKPRRAVGQFVNGFLVATDKSRLGKTVEAARLSKSLRDKITITAKTMRPATVADGIALGTITVGAWVRDL